MKKLLKLFAIVGLMVGSLSANAIPVRFDLTTDLQSPSATGTFAGFITFDSAAVTAGNTVFSSSFLDWGFTWGTDLAVNSATPGAGWVAGYNSITFNALAGITTWAICVSTPANCNYGDSPGFYSDSNGNLNNTFPSTNTRVAQVWTRATDVPEPTTLVLLGLGLLGVGAIRSRRSA